MWQWIKTEVHCLPVVFWTDSFSFCFLDDCERVQGAHITLRWNSCWQTKTHLPGQSTSRWENPNRVQWVDLHKNSSFQILRGNSVDIVYTIPWKANSVELQSKTTHLFIHFSMCFWIISPLESWDFSVLVPVHSSLSRCGRKSNSLGRAGPTADHPTGLRLGWRTRVLWGDTGRKSEPKLNQ